MSAYYEFPRVIYRDEFLCLWDTGVDQGCRRAPFRSGWISIDDMATALNETYAHVRDVLDYFIREDLLIAGPIWVIPDLEGRSIPDRTLFDYCIYLDRADCRDAHPEQYKAFNARVIARQTQHWHEAFLGLLTPKNINNPMRNPAPAQQAKPPVARPARYPKSKKKHPKTRQRKNVRQPDNVKLLYKQQKGKCWWCGEELNGVYHVDHRMPFSKGGTDDLGNLCLACPKCNIKKHDKLPCEFNGRLL